MASPVTFTLQVSRIVLLHICMCLCVELPRELQRETCTESALHSKWRLVTVLAAPHQNQLVCSHSKNFIISGYTLASELRLS